MEETLTPQTSSSAESSSALPDAPPSRAQRVLKNLGWGFLALLCLVIFTLVKLPETRLKNYVEGTINSLVAQQGMQFSSKESDLSVGFGVHYNLKDVELKNVEDETGLKLDEVTVSPSVLALIFGKTGADFRVLDGDGTLKGSFASKDTEMSFSFQAENLNLGKMGVLAFLGGIQGTAVVQGEGSLAGDLNTPSTLNGTLKLNLSKIILDAQTIQGFAVPKLSISEGVIDVTVTGGRATINTFRLGKTGSADDITATITGDIQLNRRLNASTLNVKTKFALSQNILKAFALIDALLGSGKQPDGSYAFNLSGPLSMPMPAPGGNP